MRCNTIINNYIYKWSSQLIYANLIYQYNCAFLTSGLLVLASHAVATTLNVERVNFIYSLPRIDDTQHVCCSFFFFATMKGKIANCIIAGIVICCTFTCMYLMVLPILKFCNKLACDGRVWQWIEWRMREIDSRLSTYEQTIGWKLNICVVCYKMKNFSIDNERR